MQPPPPPPAAPPYTYPQQQQQHTAGAGAQAQPPQPQHQHGAHLSQPASSSTHPPQPYPSSQPGSLAPARPAGPPPGAYGGPPAEAVPFTLSQQQQMQQQPLAPREHPPRFLGPPARRGPPQAPPPSFDTAAAQPAFQQQQQGPPTALMQQMSLQQQHQRPSYPPPPPQQQQQQARPPPPSFAAAGPPLPPPQQPQPRQQLRGPPTMLPPPPPPAFGGVVVSGGGGGGTPSAAAAGPSSLGSAAAASSSFAPPGPPQRIDPSQIPRPTANPASSSSSSAADSASHPPRPVMHRTRSAPQQQQQEGFVSQQQQGGGQEQDRHVPPPPTSAFADCPGVACADGGDASFRAMRPTLHAVPRSRDLLKSVSIPLEVLVTPLAPLLPGDDAIPLLDFGGSAGGASGGGAPPRCNGCRAYINPGFVFLNGGASFGCNLCGEVSPVPLEYSASGGGGGRLVGAVGPGGSVSGADSDLERAAQLGGPAAAPGLELLRGSYEFLAPPAFCARPPRPPARLFLIDASFGAGASGLTSASCRAAAAAIRAVAAQASEARELERERELRLLASGGGGAASSSPSPPTLVGLMSFGAAGLHFYSFGTGESGGGSGSGGGNRRREGEEEQELLSSSLEPSVLVVPDIDAPFSPASKGLFVDVSPNNSEVSERRLGALLALLEKIPALHGVGDPSSSNPSAKLADPASPSGAALAAGAAALASVGGGRLHAFLGSAGSAGPRAGALSLPRRGGDSAGAGVASHHSSSHSFDGGDSFDDAPPMQPPPAQWLALAEFSAERQVGIDVHLAPPLGTRPDGAGARAAAALCAATGGELRLHPRWSAAPAGAVCDLSEGAVEAVGCGVGTSKEGSGGEGGGDSSSCSSLFFEPGVAHGWEAVGRLRVSKGLEVLSYSGPVHRRTPLDVDFPCLGPATTVQVSLGHEGRMPSSDGRGRAVLQFAVAFTHSASGSRRVRVHTLRLPLADGAAQVFRGADADALLACGAREVAQALRGSRKISAVGSGPGGGNASVVPAAAGLLLRAGSAASLAGASAASASLAKGADPSALPASIVASSSSSGGANGCNAPAAAALPAAALAEAAAEALSKARERARACVVSPLASYRELCASTAAGGQLILPEALKLAPLAALALSKHPAVAARGRGSGSGGSGGGITSSPAPPQDERAAAAAALSRATPAALSRDLTPRLLPLHLLLDAVLGGEQQGTRTKKSLLAAAASLAPLPLSAEAVDASGVYCLVSESTLVLHAGGRADPRLIDALGMHRCGGGGSGSGNNNGFVVRVPGSAASKALWAMVDELAWRRGARLSVRSTPPAPSSPQQQQHLQQYQQQQQAPPLLATSALARLLPEDRSAAGPSYVEYLCWLHRQIQKRLM